MRRVYGTKVMRLTLGGLPICPWLERSQGYSMNRQKSAEAIVVPPPTGRRAELVKKLEIGSLSVLGMILVRGPRLEVADGIREVKPGAYRTGDDDVIERPD
jgi:hypothetical protein